MEPDKPPQVREQPSPNPSPSLAQQQPSNQEAGNQPTTPINVPQVPTSAPPPPEPTIVKQESEPAKVKKPSFWSGLRWYEYFICGIPLVLILIGGAIGGGVGGGAFALNVKLWKSDRGQMAKIASIIGVTIGSFILYFVLAILVQLLFFSGGN